MPVARATERCHQRRLRRLRRHLLPAAHPDHGELFAASAEDHRAGDSTAAAVAAFCDGVDLSGAQQALRILRHFQQNQLHVPPDSSTAAAAGMIDMMEGANLPGTKASHYIGCVVDASSYGDLSDFSDTQIEAMKSSLFSRGAVVVRGVRPAMDSANARSVAAFLSNFGEPRAEYFGGLEEREDRETSGWHVDLPLGTLQRFANDGHGVLLKSSSDELVQAGELAWHFDGEFNPWWTAHTALFCEETPFAGHSTGYACQRAAYLVALAQVPELIARLEGMRTLCTIEGLNFGSGNPGRISLDFTREAQLEAAAQSSTGQKQQTGSVTMSPDKYPAQYKPLLRTHYSAGYECFSAILCYLPEFARHWQTRHLVNIVGADGMEMGPDQASALLRSLLQFITQDAFRYYHEWRAGDLVIW
jgi:alpha-ketoglutarate-dependent taurine dioxygenase